MTLCLTTGRPTSVFWPLQAAEKGAPGAGSGDVSGPASSTDNRVARFDGSTGKLIQESGVSINDSGEITTGVWKGTEITVPYGGTGKSSFTAGALLKGDGQSAIAEATAGTDYLAPAAIGTTVQAYNAALTGITSTQVSNWDTAYGWGNHASAGYATYPSQTGNSGKFLTTNGTSTSWATVDALPSQTGNSGKYLTTDGTTASWATVSSAATKLQILTRSATTTDVSLTNGFLQVTNRSGGTVNVGVV
jgi:hypothetical protein